MVRISAAILTVFFVLAFCLIAGDRHVTNFSPSCPICQAKVSLTGSQNSFTLECYPTVACAPEVEKTLPVATPPSPLLRNKASPQASL